MKVDINRKSKAIDGLANIAKYLIEPVEERLQEQEDYVKRIEEERIDALEAARKALLTEAGVENFSFYDLRRMPVEQFDELFAGALETQRLKKEEAVKIEQERIRKEQEDQEQREKVAKENEQLKAEAEEREKAEAEEQEKRDVEEKVRKEKEAKEKEKQDKILAEEKKKAEEEKAKREALEREIKAKEEREETARREAEEKEAEHKRQDELAPDREKLMALAVTIAAIEMPKVKSKEAIQVVDMITEALSMAIAEIREGINRL